MLNMIFTFDDFEHNEEVFAELATVTGYPNLVASNTDKYQGLVNFDNLRTGQTVFQGYDGIYIEFDEDEQSIRFYSGVNKSKLLFEYKEHIIKLTEAKNAEDNDEQTQKPQGADHFVGLPKYKPYDKLHRPAVGNLIIWGDGTYQITGVRPRKDCDLLDIIIGDMTIRSDLLLENGRYINAEICGWNEDSKMG